MRGPGPPEISFCTAVRCGVVRVIVVYVSLRQARELGFLGSESRKIGYGKLVALTSPLAPNGAHKRRWAGALVSP